MRKVILYIAMSIDGFIADECGGIAFLEKGENHLYQGDYGYHSFIENVDSILWGYTTYHQVVHDLSPNHWAYEKQMSYVFTHRDIEDEKNVTFINGDPVDFLKTLKKLKGKDIWICGGANLVAPLIKANAIDEYQISIMPTILGRGIALFPDMAELNLHLVSFSSENGVLLTTYKRQQ